MATMLATITKVPHSEYRPFPLLFSDSNWGSGGEKNVNNIGRDRYHSRNYFCLERITIPFKDTFLESSFFHFETLVFSRANYYHFRNYFFLWQITITFKDTFIARAKRERFSSLFRNSQKRRPVRRFFHNGPLIWSLRYLNPRPFGFRTVPLTATPLGRPARRRNPSLAPARRTKNS